MRKGPLRRGGKVGYSDAGKKTLNQTRLLRMQLMPLPTSVKNPSNKVIFIGIYDIFVENYCIVFYDPKGLLKFFFREVVPRCLLYSKILL